MSFLFLKILDLMARHGYFWSLHSPNMNSWDVFLWEIMKDMVFKPMPVTMVELRHLIYKWGFPLHIQRNDLEGCCVHEDLSSESSGYGTEKDLIKYNNPNFIQLVPEAQWLNCWLASIWSYWLDAIQWMENCFRICFEYWTG